MSFVSHFTKKSTKPTTRNALIIFDEQGKSIIKLERKIYSIGRSSKNSIVINSAVISRHHATLFRMNNLDNNSYSFHIIDGDFQGNNSSNGLIINGNKCSQHSLQHNDIIVFGGEVKAIYIVTNSDVSYQEIFSYYEEGDFTYNGSHILLDSNETVTTSIKVEPLSEVALLRLASFTELLPSPIIEIDLVGKITYLNPAAISRFPELQEMGLSHPILAGLIDAVKHEKKDFFLREVEIGKAVFEQSVHYITESRLIRSYLVDISDRQRTEQALRESEKRYALAARAANDGLWDWDLISNEIYYSSRWKSLLGFEENEVSNSPDEWFERVHPDEVARVKKELANLIEGVNSHFESEYRMLHKYNSYRWILSQGIGVKDADGKTYRIVGAQTDITQRKIAEAQLLYDAFHDTLTGLSNRALFMNRLEHALKITKGRQNYLFAVLFLDLDRFKVINDSLGHQSGDELLIAFVKRLQVCVRNHDTVARLGGDEFSILLEDIKSIEDAKIIAQRIQEQLALPFNISNHEVFTSVSIGIAISTDDYHKPEDLLRDADIAMYRAKAQGKARYEVFNPAMYERASSMLQLENDLRRAIRNQEFVIYYQPIVALSSGLITGFEALLRWQHPSGINISPADFIPVAEDTGIIVTIGYWVLREACNQLCIWQRRFSTSPPLTMSVNISGKQFREADLIEQIKKILLETGIDPATLKLEITESVIMENAHVAANMLMQLKQLGIHIYIDDFGTGYSSLSYLHRFPCNALKIDRSFITQMCESSESSQIVQTIINLAHNLAIYVVAEGVETEEQWNRLKQMNALGGLGQGYYFSKPLYSTEVEMFMAELL